VSTARRVELKGNVVVRIVPDAAPGLENHLKRTGGAQTTPDTGVNRSCQSCFGLNASSTCFWMLLKFFDRYSSSSFVRILNGTRTTLFSNFTLR